MQGLSPVPPAPQAQVYIDPDRAAYRIVEKRGFYDDTDTLWPKGKMIYWEGRPSKSFEPLNEKAYEAMKKYLEELDAKGKEVAEKKGTGYALTVQAFEANYKMREMDKKFGRSVDIEEMTPVMGAKRDEKRKAEEIGAQQTSPIMGRKGKTAVNKTGV